METNGTQKMKGTYSAFMNETTGKTDRIRYFVENVTGEDIAKFAGWIDLGWGKFAKDAFNKREATAIIDYVISLGVDVSK